MGLEIGERVDRHRGRWDLSEHSEPSREKNQLPGLHPNGGEMACLGSVSLGSPALSIYFMCLGI